MSFKLPYYSRCGLYFDYSLMPDYFSDSEVEKRSQKLITQFGKQTRNWTNQLNSEWIVRNYLAIKMIFSSTLLLNSLKFAVESNLKIVQPYLIYYSLLNSCRAVVFTLPSVEWNDGDIINLSHNKIINLTAGAVSALNKKEGERLKKELILAKEYRELFSYRFPATGMNGINEKFNINLEDAIEQCTLLCEIAQFKSEILQHSCENNVTGNYELLDEVFRNGWVYNISNDFFFDEDDYSRIVKKKDISTAKPQNLLCTMTEGMVEDFFYPWESENSDESFNIDLSDWRLIFPIP